MSHLTFAGEYSDLIAESVLSGTLTGFYDLAEGEVMEELAEHAEEYLVSEPRVTEAAGARVTVDVSRTTGTAVMLVFERLAGAETGDLAYTGVRRGLLA